MSPLGEAEKSKCFPGKLVGMMRHDVRERLTREMAYSAQSVAVFVNVLRPLCMSNIVVTARSAHNYVARNGTGCEDHRGDKRSAKWSHISNTCRNYAEGKAQYPPPESNLGFQLRRPTSRSK